MKQRMSTPFVSRYGPWAVVAGASEGLGAAFAEALAARGMNLLLLARRAELLAEVKERLSVTTTVEVRTAACDLAQADLAVVLEGLTRDLEVGLAIYNAAYAPIGPVLSRSTDELLRVIDVNVRGPLVFARTMAPAMVARGRRSCRRWPASRARRESPRTPRARPSTSCSARACGASFRPPAWTCWFLGRHENPQWLGARVDAKMWLYLAGATLLGLNLYSFAMHHRLAFPEDPSPGIALHAGMFSFFLCEYLLFEQVHLYTYDIFAERVGFKLGWGCLLFYPYFYASGLWSTVHLPNPHTPLAWRLGAAIVFFMGWSLSRGANMQKFTFKRAPHATFLGIFAPRVVSDGERSLLVSGFWRVSRHVNYLGEILMATGLTLALGRPEVWTTWLYPLYYVALLVPRERDDDRRCAAKYGALWTRYCEQVPYRIIPWVY